MKHNQSDHVVTGTINPILCQGTLHMPAKNRLTLAYSPCPNDTYIFNALANNLIDTHGLEFDITLADVEELNGMAAAGAADIVKVSVAAMAGLLDEYILLRSGGAMGFGVGPVLVALQGRTLKDMNNCVVAIPGRRTTANLLFSTFCQEHFLAVETKELVFDQIMGAVACGDAAAGVLIHEGRFTFHNSGLALLVDLGAWWEESKGLPIPLGGIAIKRSLGAELAQTVNALIRASIDHAFTNPDAPWEYMRAHAQEMNDDVITEHVRTFVTSYSLDVGENGELAVAALLEAAGGEKRKDIFISIHDLLSKKKNE